MPIKVKVMQRFLNAVVRLSTLPSNKNALLIKGIMLMTCIISHVFHAASVQDQDSLTSTVSLQLLAAFANHELCMPLASILIH